MPPRDWRIRVQDILTAIETVAEYTRGMSYADFSSDRKTIDAVLRNITVIGEAATRIPEEIAAAHPEVPLREMRDMRNLLVHEYFGVSTRILWDTVQDDLPPVVAPLRAILQEEDP